MERKIAIHRHIEAASLEIFEFVKERMPLSHDGWVPASDIKQSLALNFVAVPKAGKQYGERGWLFATLARMLEDRDLLEHKKGGGKSSVLPGQNEVSLTLCCCGRTKKGDHGFRQY